MLDGAEVSDPLFGSAPTLFLEDAVEEIQVLNPGETLSHLRKGTIESQRLLDRFIGDLRKAGLPE